MAHQNLAWAKEHFNTIGLRYAQYQRYYDGEHPLRIADELREAFSKLLGESNRHNCCPTVCDELSDRIDLVGFTCTNDANQPAVDRIWEAAQLAVVSAAIHADAVTLGDAYLIVWPDPVTPRQPRVYNQVASNMAVRYEEAGEGERIAEAIKAWLVTDPNTQERQLRVTRYLPNRVERYISRRGITSLPDDTDELLPYAEEAGQPAEFTHSLGMPVFRLPNSLRTNRWARSELVDVIPLQDDLNKALMDLMVAGEFHGLPQRWATGLTTYRNPETGDMVKPFTVGADRVWSSPSTDVKFGQFDTADLQQLLAVMVHFVQAIAQVSRTPLHLFGLAKDSYPSGEALKTAEAGIVKKAIKRQVAWGPIWEAVMDMCLRIAGVSAGPFKAAWEPAMSRSEREAVELAVQKATIGVSHQQLQRELGYDEDAIATMADEVSEQQANALESAAAAFNRGAV